MTPDIREKAERLLDGLGAFQTATRGQKIGALSQALLEAHNAGREEALQPDRGWKWKLVPDYPVGEVVGPCVCGSWPGGECLQCPVATTPPDIRSIK